MAYNEHNYLVQLSFYPTDICESAIFCIRLVVCLLELKATLTHRKTLLCNVIPTNIKGYLIPCIVISSLTIEM